MKGSERTTLPIKHVEVGKGTLPLRLDVEKARDYLARCKDVDQAREVRDRVMALGVYLRTRGASLAAQNDAAEIALRAERRLGEMMQQIPKAKGVRLGGDKLSPPDGTPTLAARGISKKQSQRWQLIASLPATEFEEHIRVVRAKSRRLTTSSAVELARAKTKREILARLAVDSPALPSGPFRVFVADPPWPYEMRADEGTHRGAAPYPSMSVNAIRDLPVAALACDDAILWLWTTNAFMRDALDVVTCWGFAAKTILTWVKSRMGVGDWLRGRTEHCILGVRGRPVVLLTNQTTVLVADARGHSRKPESFYAMVEALCPGSKVELFSRTRRAGWQSWGAEVSFLPRVQAGGMVGRSSTEGKS